MPIMDKAVKQIAGIELINHCFSAKIIKSSKSAENFRQKIMKYIRRHIIAVQNKE